MRLLATLLFVGLMGLAANVAAQTEPDAEADAGADSGSDAAAGADADAEADEEPSISVPLTSCHGKRIRRIRVRGARRVDPEDIKATMKLGRGDICTDPQLTRDARKVWDMRYFSDLVFETEPRGNGITLLVRVAERPLIRSVLYEGNDEIDDDDINETLLIKEGDILAVRSVREQVGLIQDLYASEGFFLAQVNYEVRAIDDDTNQVDVVFKIDEGDEVTVRRVDFTGNKELPSEELRKFMQTGETGFFSFLAGNNKFNRDAFDQDVNNVQAWYYNKGYLTMRIGQPRVELTADRSYVDIMIPIEEGPRFKVRKIRVREADDEGNDIETLRPKKRRKKQLRDFVDLNEGDWFNRAEIGEGIEAITRTYRDSGYAFAEVSPATTLDEATREVDVDINIKRGVPVYIERIIVRGNTKTRDAVIRREFRINEGDLYNQSKVEFGRDLVNQLGFFERVDLSEEQGSAPDLLVINVEVAERATGQFQVGAGFSSLESFIITAQIQQQNLFGRGQSLSLNLQLSGIRQQIQVQFVEPWFLGSQWSLGLGAFKILRDFAFFRQDSTGGSISTGHPIFDPRFRFGLQYRLEKVNIASRGSSIFGGSGGDLGSIFGQIALADLFRDGFTSSIQAFLTWDNRDNRITTSNGQFAQYSIQFADSVLGSDNTFVRQEAFARFYKNIFGPFIFKVNAQFGLITSRKPNGVPLFERFYLGGIFTLRGYDLQSVGPKGSLTQGFDPNLSVPPQGLPFGGDFQAFYNIELEFPIVTSVGIRGVFFTDGGNAWNLFSFRDSEACQAPPPSQSVRSSQPCGFHPYIRTSWGFGIRWFSPLGPLRFEWGIPIRRRQEDSRIRFEFTIGNSF